LLKLDQFCSITRDKSNINMSTRVCLIGYGRMGKSIEKLLVEYNCLVTKIINSKEDWIDLDNNTIDVAIDFSLPGSAFLNISECIERSIPIVSGTTGWLDKLPEIRKKLKDYPNSSFLYGSNFSLGMNLFFRINKKVAALLTVDPSYKLSMKEIHHTNKLDKPSGTAISLAEDIIGLRNDKTSWINENTEENNVIGIISERSPDVPGTHEVRYTNQIDEITISHEAKSREGFARGAILAAKWIIGKKGYFTINDFVDDLLYK